MVRSGVIEGRVVDPDGEPVADAEVMAESYVTIEGKRRLRPTVGGQTDDRGQYRIFSLAPGKYCISARPRNSYGEEQGDLTYPVIYYPGTPFAHEAARIEVSPGAELHGIDFSLMQTKAFSFSGKVVRSDGKPVAEAILMTMRLDESQFPEWVPCRASVDAGGNFKITGLLPGRYRILAESGRSEKPQMASVTVDVSGQSASGVILALGNGGELSGRVIIEGGAPKSVRGITRVMLESWDGSGMMGFRAEGGDVSDDQTFSIRNVTEGSYRLQVLAPGSLYLKTARVQSREALDEALDIHNGERVTGIEIILSANGGERAGVVKQEETGEVVKDATVVLFSADPNHRGPHSRWTRTTQTDQRGNFHIRGLEPAKYMALLNHETESETNPEYLQKVAMNAKVIVIEPQSKLSEAFLVQSAPPVD